MLRAGDSGMDCGANMGALTALLAATAAEVLAYEIDSYAFSVLEEKFAKTLNVTLINAAVGVRADAVRLLRSDNFGDTAEGASVKSTMLDGGRRMDAGSAVEVTLPDFPALVREHVTARGEIDFIKIDIEAAELEILETLDREYLFTNIAVPEMVAAKYPVRKVNLDWI